ncbi:SLC13 family permease [Oceanihabitans sp. 1_MG-2023]|uniref:SLC13 family permease n=1 Tax=Flavobacteriaceae TaxID=49546 RepID=UPI00209163F4|nr:MULTISPECIES: SLC13 family permease [Flavobacteriaceae]MDO6623890.1 SLC13 family permease [Oceanihabitans sp. 1_MG-2023]
MLAILSITIILFIWGKFTPDIIALMSMLSLFLFGILNVTETLSGFSNPTVIMIAALFIIGEGLSQTGWTALAGEKLIKMAGKSKTKLLVLTTFGSGLLSGFVSNTGTVATLMPVTIASAWSINTLPSKLLMPVAFGSNTGGLLTLTGTPPNIIVNNTMLESGLKEFSFFEFGLIGLPLLLLTLLYFKFIGYKLLPENKTNNKPIDISKTLHAWIEAYKVDGDYYRLRVRSVSPLLNTKLGDWNFENLHGVSILRIKRRHPNRLKGKDPFIELPTEDTEFLYHDIITVKGETQAINELMIKLRLGLLPLEPIANELRNNLINREVGMTEILVTPQSTLVGKQIKSIPFFNRYNVQLMAASRNSKPLITREITIKAGDSFLIRGEWSAIDDLKKHHEHIVICGSPEGMAKTVTNITTKSYIALFSLVLMIFLLVFKIVPGAIAALISAGIVLITGCVPMAKAYKGISWVSVVMIAAMIPMGIALQKTGAASLIANGLVTTLGNLHPIVLLAGIFLLTTAFSQVINNSATAVLMAPIVIIAANTLSISAAPFMIVVAISASTAFLTPVGTTTNAMVMAAGGYKFTDYIKVGAPLLLLFLITSLILVPLFWPF